MSAKVKSKKSREKDFDIRDLSLHQIGKGNVENARLDMKGLDALLEKYGSEKPLKGSRITGCVTVTYETANLILTLKDLGASLR
tara:strand:- start:175 stop:426 length:252 start_codon:yes stop_codon:yes gene_type:complete